MEIGRMMFGSTGMNVNRMLDAIGLPDSFGDVVGTAIDTLRGDPMGMYRNAMDLSSGLSTHQMSQLFGTGLPPSQFVPRPYIGMPRYGALWGNTYAMPYGMGMGTEMQPSAQNVRVGPSVERAMLTGSPAVRAMIQERLGGIVVPDRRLDGRVTVLRYTPTFGNMSLSNSLMSSNPIMSGIFRGLSLMQNNMGFMNQNLINPGFNVPGAPMEMVVRDYETAQIGKGMGMTPPLSFEDMLFLMMMKYARKKEKEIIGKMNELSGKKNGVLGGFGNFLGSVAGIGGTILGGLAGGFPLGTMIGGQLGSALGGMLSGQGSAGAFGNANQQSDTTKQMQMQKLMEDLKKMYEMLSNVMKSMNSMQMAAVRNLPR